MNKRQMWAIVFLVIAIALSVISLVVAVAIDIVEKNISGSVEGRIQLTIEPQEGRVLDGGYNYEER